MRSLATKYRPQNLDEMVGQETTVKTLKRQVEVGQIKNCLLFCGASGCGKTSLARAYFKLLNGGKGEPIEVDAASNSGVDNVRLIIDSAKERAIDGGKYKCYILDECFVGDTLVNTQKGKVPIQDICSGDYVYTLCGLKRVYATHKLQVKPENLCVVTFSNGKQITVTKNHLFFTTNGWIKASKLLKGDKIVDYENLSNLWEGIQQSELDLLCGVWKNLGLVEAENLTSTEDVYTYLCSVWKNLVDNEKKLDKDLLQGMLFEVAINESEEALCYRIGDGTQVVSIRKGKKNCGVLHTHPKSDSRNISKNEISESYVESKKYREDDVYEGIKWDTASVEGTSWGKWKIYCGIDAVVRELRKFLGIGISNSYTDKAIEQSEQIPYFVQSRPCLSINETCGRGGWQFASLEKTIVDRLEKGAVSEPIRVESVEVYQRRNKEQSIGSDSEYIDVYDLSVEGSPTYFVDDILVHNCHGFSNAAWQSWLKCIEEPPAYTIFIFCTTEVQKIPATILNRCMRFNFNRIPFEQIKNRLKYICSRENVIYDEDSIDFIAKLSNGGMRDAISLMEKVIDFGGLNIENTLNCLGEYSYSTMFNLMNAIIDCDEPLIFSTIESIYNGGDLKQFINQFFTFVIDLSKYCVFKSMTNLKIPSSLEEEVKRTVAIENPSNYLMYIMRGLLDLRNMLKTDTSIKDTVEVCLLKVARGL